MPTGPQRLVLIRSGPYEYAEVELASGTLQIVGPNNAGKTTLINTLQFLYIDDRRHMDFGSYTAEQTREFYFPNQYSYVLFECLGATGECVFGWRGQSKASGGEPERFYHSGPFSATDFLDGKNQVREPREVSARLGASKHYRLIKSAQEQREMLLPATGGNERGLGIVALRDGDKYYHFRETLKDLLSLSAITQEQMRDRILMLADIPTDRVAIDAREFQDYDLLEQRKKRLKRFMDNQPLVEKLVGKFDEREATRGELVWRWTDLRAKRQIFEKEHEESLTKLREERMAQETRVKEVAAELTDRRHDLATFSEQKGQLLAPLKIIDAKDKEFSGFLEDWERLALANLKQGILAVEMQLANAEGESRETIKRNVDHFTSRAKQKEESIAHFDRLLVTTLREHFADSELSIVFRILNRELLELPVGKDGVAVSQPDGLRTVLRHLLIGVQDGVYRDSNVSFPLPKTVEPLAGLENLDAARAQLDEYQTMLKRWREMLAAVEQREALEAQRNARRGEIEAKERRLFQFDEYRKAKASEPQLRAELRRIEEGIVAAKERLGKLETQHNVAARAKTAAETSIQKQQDDFDAIMVNFSRCNFPEFSTKPRAVEGIPRDFGAAIVLFLRQQERQGRLCEDVSNLLGQTEQWFADEFRGEDEGESVRNLREELDALAEKEDALARDWNAHLHGLKATFDLVLKNLDHVKGAVAEINRAFAKVEVSNLKAVRLEMVERSDLVNWIRRLATFEPGGLFDADPQQESTIANFRRRLEIDPVVRFADLFTLGFTVTRANDQRRTYHDLRQIESDGTTITIKVLFSLLLLKRQLRSDDCSVPFFLDEIQALDPDNRHAILRTARQLGFIAITAAPQAVSEVDAIYFLQPQKGKIVLRHKHRATIKRTNAAIEP